MLVVGAFAGLRILGSQKTRSSEEFEKGAAEGASLLSAGVNAINGMLNPEVAKGNEAVKELKKGTYNKKQSDGKSLGKTNSGRGNDR